MLLFNKNLEYALEKSELQRYSFVISFRYYIYLERYFSSEVIKRGYRQLAMGILSSDSFTPIKRNY